MNQAMIDKGIVLSGKIGRNKNNLFSGAFKPPFLNVLSTVTGSGTEMADRVGSMLGCLGSLPKRSEMTAL